jgi:hypothetical protein
VIGDKEDIDSLLQSCCLELVFEPEAAVKRACASSRSGSSKRYIMAAKFCFENLDPIYIQALIAMIFVSFGYIYTNDRWRKLPVYTYMYVIDILVPAKILGDC